MLCPRCSGLHIGFFFTLFLLQPFQRKGIKLTGWFLKWFSIAALSFLFFEWMLAQFGTISSTAASRYFSGLFAGAAFCQLVLTYRSRVFQTNSYKETSNQLPLITCIATSLLSGLLFYQLTNWAAVTLALLLAVFINFLFFLYTMFERMYLIYLTQKQKST